MSDTQQAVFGHSKKRVWFFFAALATFGIIVAVGGLYAFRAPFLSYFAQSYLASQGVPSSIVVDSVDARHLVAHGSLGSNNEISAGRIVLYFAPGRWLPFIDRVEAENITVQVSIAPNHIQVGSLQPWLDRLLRAQSGQKSQFISDNVFVALRHVSVAAATSAGPLVVDADAKLQGSKLISADAVLRPADVRYGTVSASLARGMVRVKETQTGVGLQAELSGRVSAAVAGMPLKFGAARLAVDVPEIRWKALPRGRRFVIPTASFRLTTADETVRGAPVPIPLSLATLMQNVAIAFGDGRLRAEGIVTANAKGSLAAADATALVSPMTTIGATPKVVRKLALALTNLDLTAHAGWDAADDSVQAVWTSALTLEGANGLSLRLLPYDKTGQMRLDSSGVSARFKADASGPGLGSATLGFPSLSWKRNSSLDGALALATRLDIGAFRDASIAAAMHIASAGDAVSITLDNCAHLLVGSWTMSGKTTLRNIKSDVCPAGDRPFFRISRDGWSGGVTATRSQFEVIAAGAQLAGGASISFVGNRTGLQIAIVHADARVSDLAKSRRFERLQLRGHIALDRRDWHGEGTIETGKNVIGTFVLSHNVASRTGSLVIASKDVVFAPNALKPADLSPLLSRVAQADGGARFEGRIDWKGNRMRSGGRLDVDNLKFTSPLGAAERLQTHLIFASLLPPATAPAQEITIEKVNWVSPLTAVETRLSFDASNLRIAAARTELAGGTISLQPLTVSLKSPSKTSSAADVAHLDLGTLIASSNLGGKVKFEGRISGHLPFSFGPQGIAVTGGRITGDGPGGLSIDPSLWGNAASNPAEGFAYKALQNLAFDTLSATADSEQGGRLRIVFHIKGHTEAPGSDEVKVLDLIQGNAFQKDIPLPQGTPIDLTLDTSLNFDELLRGYEAAWSEATSRSKEQP